MTDITRNGADDVAVPLPLRNRRRHRNRDGASPLRVVEEPTAILEEQTIECYGDNSGKNFKNIRRAVKFVLNMTSAAQRFTNFLRRDTESGTNNGNQTASIRQDALPGLVDAAKGDHNTPKVIIPDELPVWDPSEKFELKNNKCPILKGRPTVKNTIYVVCVVDKKNKVAHIFSKPSLKEWFKRSNKHPLIDCIITPDMLRRPVPSHPE